MESGPLMLRGTSAGLEFVFAGRSFEDAWTEMSERLAERPDFYRGSRATAIFDEAAPDDASLEGFLNGIAPFGIELRGVYGGAPLAPVAQRHGLAYLGAPERPTVAKFERKRAKVEADLTERARSLDADFAGARADIAKRRASGETSVPRPNFQPPAAATRPGAAVLAPVEAIPATLYHRGTLRGGQTLQQVGTIVVVGDVNPGAELVATGDIVVVGALRGTAHAGAQGDAAARVVALDMSPTQLRIATLIAMDAREKKARVASVPEVATIVEGRIAIAPLSEGVR